MERTNKVRADSATANVYKKNNPEIRRIQKISVFFLDLCHVTKLVVESGSLPFAHLALHFTFYISLRFLQHKRKHLLIHCYFTRIPMWIPISVSRCV